MHARKVILVCLRNTNTRTMQQSNLHLLVLYYSAFMKNPGDVLPNPSRLGRAVPTIGVTPAGLSTVGDDVQAGE